MTHNYSLTNPTVTELYITNADQEQALVAATPFPRSLQIRLRLLVDVLRLRPDYAPKTISMPNRILGEVSTRASQLSAELGESTLGAACLSLHEELSDHLGYLASINEQTDL